MSEREDCNNWRQVQFVKLSRVIRGEESAAWLSMALSRDTFSSKDTLWSPGWLWSQSWSMLVCQRVEFSPKCLKTIFQCSYSSKTLLREETLASCFTYAPIPVLLWAMGRAWILLQVWTGATSEQVCPVTCFLHRSDDAGVSMAMVTAIWPSPHPVLDISTAKPWQHLGHFTSPAEAVQQAGARQGLR